MLFSYLDFVMIVLSGCCAAAGDDEIAQGTAIAIGLILGLGNFSIFVVVKSMLHRIMCVPFFLVPTFSFWCGHRSCAHDYRLV
jgi:hypothetical protein